MQFNIIRHKNLRSHIILLLVWLVLGTILRFANLDSKPPWADEWATLVFSLGNSFLSIPLDRIVSFEILMQPLHFSSKIVVADVIHNLFSESNHPPVYFVLNHLWLNFLSIPNTLVSIFWARSLSAFWGILAIPAIFYLSFFISGSLFCGQLAAALMAFSPYGVYLAQEVRHYTFAILLIIASMTCLVATIKCIEKNQKVTSKIIFFWIVINSLGVATHYFFALALVAEILVLGTWLIKDIQTKLFSLRSSSPWWGIFLAVTGTITGCSVWVWIWLNIPDNQLTDWTRHGNPWSSEFFEPWGRIIAWMTTMIVLLPIEGIPLWVVIVSVIIVLYLLIYLFIAGRQFYQKFPDNLIQKIIGKYLFFSILLILAFVYFGDRDLTLAARFQFFYFPCTIVFVATILQQSWQQKSKKFWQNLTFWVLIISFCGSLTVVNNYGYQKPDRADLVVPVIREAQSKNPRVPILIATVHKHHEQTGEMMSIAWEWLRNVESEVAKPQFIFLHKKPDTPERDITLKFKQQLATLSRPLDVWVVNFSAPTGLESQNCQADLNYKRRVAGYRYRLFHCF